MTTYLINDSYENGETCIMPTRMMRTALHKCAVDWARGDDDESLDEIFEHAMGLCIKLESCRDEELLHYLLENVVISVRSARAVRKRLRELNS